MFYTFVFFRKDGKKTGHKTTKKTDAAANVKKSATSSETSMASPSSSLSATLSGDPVRDDPQHTGNEGDESAKDEDDCKKMKSKK